MPYARRRRVVIRRKRRPLRLRRRRVYRRTRRMFSDNKPHYFHRYIGMAGVWADLQSSVSDPYGLSILAGGTGSSVSLVGNRFVVTCGANTTTYVNICYAFQYRHVPAVSEFANLFDQYRIAGFAFRIAPGQNTVIDGAGSLPIGHSVIDYDDATLTFATEAGLNEFRERGSYRVARFDGRNKMLSRYVPRPSIRIGAIDDSGNQVALVRGAKKWLDSAIRDVPHFGVKIMLEMHNPTGGAIGVNFELMAKAYFSCKQVH